MSPHEARGPEGRWARGARKGTNGVNTNGVTELFYVC